MATVDPFEALEALFRQAFALDIKNPNAMTLCTVDEQGQPSSRTVLLKAHDRRGLVFYTNLESRKGQEIAANAKVALTFYWRELGQQVQVRGVAEPVSEQEADEYFASRDRGSQLGAWASQQSRPLGSKAQLVAEVAKVEARHLGGRIRRPPHWSGFRVVPDAIEIWSEGRFRLHDRIAYEREGLGWRRYRKYP